MRVIPTKQTQPFRMFGSLATRDDDSMLPQLACGLKVATGDIAIVRSDDGKSAEVRAADGSVVANIADDGDRVTACPPGLSAIESKSAAPPQGLRAVADPWPAPKNTRPARSVS
jgi:hypothetical protein